MRLQETGHRFFANAQHDVLITPATPTAAIPADTRSVTVHGVERSFFDQTGWANLTSHIGLPSLVVPVGRNTDGLLMGVQLVGPAHADRTLLAMAEDLLSALEAAVGQLQGRRPWPVRQRGRQSTRRRVEPEPASGASSPPIPSSGFPSGHPRPAASLREVRHLVFRRRPRIPSTPPRSRPYVPARSGL
ncbi:amidase family protein [Streptomyces sp. NPDC059575]|uniref:amidase family protein n=1 Tax=Streptomyces sp. NPDC059575 TaxID=3346872 RepID=UPI0036B58DFB